MIRRRTAVALLATAIPVVAWAATDFTYDTPQTGYYSIHSMSFAPDGASNSGGYFNSWRLGRLVPDRDVQQCLNTGVNLPDGAIVKEVQVWFRSKGTHGLYTTLIRTPLSTGNGGSIGGGTFSDSSGERVTRVRAVDAAVATIDNGRYSYGFGICIQDRTTFEGARIKYTYRSAGD